MTWPRNKTEARQTVELGDDTREFLRQLVEELGEGGDSTKLDAIIAMLQELAHLPAELALLVERVNIIHELVSGGLQQQIDEATAALKSSTDKVEQAINNQPKGNE